MHHLARLLRTKERERVGQKGPSQAKVGALSSARTATKMGIRKTGAFYFTQNLKEKPSLEAKVKEENTLGSTELMMKQHMTEKKAKTISVLAG